FIIGIPAGALGLTVQHFTAWLSKRSKKAYLQAKQKTLYATLGLGLAFTLLFVMSASFLQNFFQVDSVFLFYLFAPAILGSFSLYWLKSFIKGHLDFVAAASLIVSEGIFKLIGIMYVLQQGYGLVGVITVYSVSILLANLVSLAYIKKRPYRISQSKNHTINETSWKNISDFYGPVLMSQLGLMILLSVDIIYLKHLVAPEVAGQYALLTVIGKIIILGTTSIISAITPFIAQKQNVEKSNKTIVIGSALILGIMMVNLIIFSFASEFIANLLLGENGLSVASLLRTYTFAVGALSLGLFVIEANLQQKRFSFASI